MTLFYVRGRVLSCACSCWRLVGAVLLLVGACGAAGGQQQAVGTLRIQAREVVLDVVVTDAKGNYVGGLKQGDFSVYEDNQKQAVKSFHAPAARGAEDAAGADAAPEVHSSADLPKVGDRTLTILVLDELNTKFADMAYARGAMEKWLNRQPARLLQPTVLLAASDEKFSVVHDYTEDRGALLAALKQHFPSYPFRMSKGGSIGPDAGERLALSLGSLIQIAQASSGTAGRKNVIWVGVGFPSLLLDDVSGTQEDELTAAVRSATNLMLASRLTLNVVDPTSMADSSIDMNNPDYMSMDVINEIGNETGTQPMAGYLNFSTFAPATGGTVFRGRNDVDREIQQAVDNSSNFYTLTYSPTNKSDDPSKFRNIRIVMRDPNLRATTRTGYFHEKALKAGEAPPPPAARTLAFDLTSAGLSTMVYSGLSLEAKADGSSYVVKVRAAGMTPHVLADGARMDEVTVMQVCFNARNRVLSHNAFEVQAKLPADMSPATLVDFRLSPFVVPAGTARMRLVVRDAVSGHIGTLDVAHP